MPYFGAKRASHLLNILPVLFSVLLCGQPMMMSVTGGRSSALGERMVGQCCLMSSLLMSPIWATPLPQLSSAIRGSGPAALEASLSSLMRVTLLIVPSAFMKQKKSTPERKWAVSESSRRFAPMMSSGTPSPSWSGIIRMLVPKVLNASGILTTGPPLTPGASSV